MVTLATLRAYWRFLVVLKGFLPLLLAYARDRRRFLLFGGRRRVSPETQARRAEALLGTLLTLGPTFIKLGQLLSSRPDVLPPAYIEVLSQLQDRVPPADWADARQVVEAEIGPVDERFDEFDTEPISGASLGQVYVGAVDGRDVAVKVRRPNVESLVEADLRVIRWSLPVVTRLVGQSRAFSLSNLADEFAKTIREEMDYEREGRMLEEIRANFSGNDGIRIPEVLDSHSGQRVLTMEYVPGTKITDVGTLEAKGLDRGAIAEEVVRAYLQMIVEDGVFHADPHPGNLAVQDDGTVVLYDFGMSGRVDPWVQDNIVDFYVAAAERDTEQILDALVAMGTLSPDADRRTMGQVMELAIEDARGEAVDQYRVQRIIQQVEDTIYEFPFRLPRNLALVLRVATVVEGVCVTLDEEFDFITTATAYLTERGYREESVRRIVEEVGDDLRDATLASLRIPPKLDDTLTQLEQGSVRVQSVVTDSNDVIDRLARRVVYGLVLASLVVATATLYPADPLVAAVPAGLGVLVALLLYRSFRSASVFAGTPGGTPQFTRQAMRERERRRD
ncbi:MAG: AarF/ABC1/UbiB kinase family protein [Halobacteriales archaeon]|nr:AarF/ABC1/UbiB kinase family protein [Halobacteriales archaeon]